MKNTGIFKFFKQWFALGTKLYNNYETFKKENPELVEKLEDAIEKQAKKQL